MFNYKVIFSLIFGVSLGLHVCSTKIIITQCYRNIHNKYRLKSDVRWNSDR